MKQKKPKTPEQTERNVEIYARYKLGETLESIGRLFDVTRQRCYQICIVMANREAEQEADGKPNI
jgi:Mor family transcriptional regulator